jgi:hypothetical protein
MRGTTQIRVEQLIQQLAKCSRTEANAAAPAVCSDPAAMRALLGYRAASGLQMVGGL